MPGWLINMGMLVDPKKKEEAITQMRKPKFNGKKQAPEPHMPPNKTIPTPNSKTPPHPLTMWKLLQVAVDKGDAQEVERLVKLGADPNKMGGRILDFAISNLIYNYKNLEPSNLKVVRLLLENGAKPNIVWAPGTGATTDPLHDAVKKDEFHLAKLLLEYGADPNLHKVNRKHRADCESLIKLAERNKNKEMIKLLKSYGAKRGFLWW